LHHFLAVLQLQRKGDREVYLVPPRRPLSQFVGPFSEPTSCAIIVADGEIGWKAARGNSARPLPHCRILYRIQLQLTTGS
jgi:hypothetical protein